MNVLLITEAFPPAPLVGSFRAANVARAFRGQGHDVHVLTLLGGTGAEPRGELEPGITWERIAAWPGPRQAYLALRGDRSREPEGSGPQGSAQDTHGRTNLAISSRDPADVKSGFRGLMAGLMTLPDDRQGFVPAVLRAAWRRRRKIDVVYSTAPCFSSHLAGRAVKTLTRAVWYAEFRDPWVGNASRTKYDGTPILARLDDRLERWCLAPADGIVAVSPMAAAHYEARYPRGPHVLCALNGVADVASAERVRTPGPLRVVYAGSVYPPRNPAPVVEALRNAWPDAGVENLELTFVGATGWAEAPGLEQATSRLPAGIVVRRLPWIPQEQARELIRDADLLLLPAQEWLLQIPNKLYDYLGSRVPVLALAERRSDTAAMLERAGGHFIAYTDGSDADLSRAAAAALHAAGRGARAGDETLLQRWRTSEQLGALVQEITGRILRDRPSRGPAPHPAGAGMAS